MGCFVDQINVGDKDILFFYLFPSFLFLFLASGIARIRVVHVALFFLLISGMYTYCTDLIDSVLPLEAEVDKGSVYLINQSTFGDIDPAHGFRE